MTQRKQQLRPRKKVFETWVRPTGKMVTVRPGLDVELLPGQTIEDLKEKYK